MVHFSNDFEAIKCESLPITVEIRTESCISVLVRG
jgi:hypothetical protein